MKNLGQIIVALGVAAALVSGCKGKEGDDKKAGGGAASGKFASCDVVESMQSCKQYADGNLAIGTDHLKSICDSVKGKFADTACPAAGQTGVCAKREGTDVYYTGYPIDLAKVEADCKATEGTWKKP